MSAEQIDAYLKAKVEYDDAKSEIEKIASALVDIARVLRQKPLRFIFSNTSGGLPMEASMSSDSVSADANAWPDPPKIMKALDRLHSAHRAYGAAWHGIDERLRSGLQRPPTEVVP